MYLYILKPKFQPNIRGRIICKIKTLSVNSWPRPTGRPTIPAVKKENISV